MFIFPFIKSIVNVVTFVHVSLVYVYNIYIYIHIYIHLGNLGANNNRVLVEVRGSWFQA